MGATNPELADFFSVATSTIDKWIAEIPEFSGAVKEGRAAADAHVGQRLFERATGYSHPEEKVFCQNGEVMRAKTIKHYPPDTTACIFWLKNRKPELWRDRIEHTGKDGGPIETADVSEMEVARRVAYLFHTAEKQETQH